MYKFLWLMGPAIICMLDRPAAADEFFRYNYMQLSSEKTTQHAEGFSPKIAESAYGLSGSYALKEVVAIEAQYTKFKTSFNGSYLGSPAYFNAKGNDLAIGATLHKMINERAELGLKLARIHSNVDAYTETVAGIPKTIPAFSSNANSLELRGRMALFIPAFRVRAAIGRATGGNSNATTHYSMGAEYEVLYNISLDIGYHLSTSSPGHARGISFNALYYFY